MANPTPSTVHIDRALTNVSTAYYQSSDAFIGGKVFPRVPVQYQTDKYFVFDKNDSLRERAVARGPGTESAGGGFRVSTDSYSASVYAWHIDIDDQQLNNADGGIDLMRSAARLCTDVVMRQMEADFATTAFAASVWGIDLAGTTHFVKWDAANSTPIEDIETQRVAILKKTGRRPNTLVLGAEVYSKLKNHPDLRERIQFVSDSIVTREIMARLLEVDRLFVADAVHATNLEGETAAYDFMLGKHAWLGYVASSPSITEPTAGYQFVWDGVSDGTSTQVGTVQIQIPERRVTRVESQLSWDTKIVGTDLGAFFGSAIS